MTRGRGGVVLLGIALLTGCTPVPGEQATAADVEEAEVVAVVDGDTIDVATEDGTARVRLIGIDTPEIGRDGEPGECYAEDARDYLDALLYGRAVELRSDPTQDTTDAYGRLLRHVFIDGQSAAVLAIEAGAGYEYTYDAAYAGRHEHLEAQDVAAGAAAGVWSECG